MFIRITKLTAAILCCIILGCIILAGAAYAGPVLEDLLNYPVVDQKCPEEILKEEGPGLAGDGLAAFIPLTKEKPLGQTVKLSPNADVLWRIQVGLIHWPDHWQEGEAITLSVYDSPKKSQKLCSRTIEYDHKWFKWDVAFDINKDIEPNADLYIELTHNGGADNTLPVVYIPDNQYKRGQAYVAGEPTDDFDLYFAVICKPKPDREANLKRFFSRFNWDYPPLAEARKAYEAGDYDRAGALLIEHFKTRTKPSPLVPDPPKNPNLDRANHVVLQGKLYKDDNPSKPWIQMDPTTTWREVWPGTAEYVRVNDVLWSLGEAYAATGDERYAEKLSELMADYIQDHTSPFEGGMRGGMWVPMFQAWRLGDAWGGWGYALGSEGLSNDVALAWLDYKARMAHFAMTEPSYGNHANAVAEALISFGKRFPEFARSQEWIDFGFDLLVTNSLELFYEDGACKEPTMNYHGYSLTNLMLGVEKAKELGMEIPQSINELIEKALVYTSYMLTPRGIIPAIGDTNIAEFRPNVDVWQGWREGEARKAWEMYGREDCRYISTVGKEGKRPEENSYCFPDIGHYILRSDWGGENGVDFEQARWLLFRAGRFGSHGHWDLNSVILYAYGRDLLIDPGRTTYGTPLMYELTEPKSHNVLLCDDHKAMLRPEPQVMGWYTTADIDLIDNYYENIYPGVNHRRAVIFVRPDYYVMFDTATSNEPHNLGINFWLTPPEVEIDRSACAVRSTEPEGSNVLVQVADRADVEMVDRKGTVDFGDRNRDDFPVITFWRKGVKDAQFTTLMYPYPRYASSRGISADALDAVGGQVCKVTAPTWIHYVAYTTDGGTVETDELLCEARSAVVRTIDGEYVNSFSVVDGAQVDFYGEVLFKSDRPLDELSVTYDREYVIVNCSQPAAPVEVAARGRMKARVNGVERTIAGDKLVIN